MMFLIKTAPDNSVSKIARCLAIICVFLGVSLISACSKTESPSLSNAELLNTKWMLKELRGHTDITSEKDVFLQFMSEDNKVSGNSGCNNFFGEYEINDDLLEAINLGSTKMMCQSMVIEDAFLNYMQNVQRFELHGDELSLFDAAGRFAVFTAVSDKKTN